MTFQTTAQRHPEYGSKRVCTGCGARFYDLTRTPAVCPKCGLAQAAVQPRALTYRASAMARRTMKAEPPPVVSEVEETVILLDAEDDEESEDEDEVEDAPELGETAAA